MILHKRPIVFRCAGMLLLISAVLGQWWQRQPLGADGHALVAMMTFYCPRVGSDANQLTVADSAHLLDRWVSVILGDLIGGVVEIAAHCRDRTQRQEWGRQDGQAKPGKRDEKRAGLIRTSGFGEHAKKKA